MRGAWRAIGAGAFIVVALGTAWALEHQAGRRTQAGATDHVIAPATVTPREDPGAGQATAPRWQPQYDRSDLQLIQG